MGIEFKIKAWDVFDAAHPVEIPLKTNVYAEYELIASRAASKQASGKVALVSSPPATVSESSKREPENQEANHEILEPIKEERDKSASEVTFFEQSNFEGEALQLVWSFAVDMPDSEAAQKKAVNEVEPGHIEIVAAPKQEALADTLSVKVNFSVLLSSSDPKILEAEIKVVPRNSELPTGAATPEMPVNEVDEGQIKSADATKAADAVSVKVDFIMSLNSSDPNIVEAEITVATLDSEPPKGAVALKLPANEVAQGQVKLNDAPSQEISGESLKTADLNNVEAESRVFITHIPKFKKRGGPYFKAP
jgi:hypothetical protein